MMDKINKTN